MAGGVDDETGAAGGSGDDVRATRCARALIAAVKSIQIIDGADNATYSIFQATDQEFEAIFPGHGEDIEVVEDFVSRVGEKEAGGTLSKLWERPIHKRQAQGIQGTLYYDYKEKSKYLPKSKREIDRASGQINEAQRALYTKLRLAEI
jgi:hypothetical protein